MDAREIERELRKRRGVIASAFDAQRTAIEHPSRRKALLLPRRSGKTTTCIIDALNDSRTHPGARYGYIALTRPSAENIAWPIFQQLDRDFNLNCHFQEQKLAVTTPNNARIQLFGADHEKFVERLRGIKWRRIYVDEAAFYSVDLKWLIDEILEPGTMDSGGTIYLISTPGDVCAGYFYDITKGAVPGWENFRWTPLDNPHVAEQYQKTIAEKKALNPEIEKDPGFRREYLGEWTEDDKNLVYNTAILIDSYEPSQETDNFVLAVDFGYREDATSFTLACYSDKHPNYIVLESWKQHKMIVPDIADAINDFRDRFPNLHIVGDPASAQFLDELRSRFAIPIADADKTNKYDWIKLYNSDAATSRVKIVRDSCKDLIDEQKKLVKQIKFNNQWREHPQCKNDCCDSNLYAYRHAYHFRYTEKVPEPEPGSREFIERQMAEYWAEESDKYEKESMRRGNGWI